MSDTKKKAMYILILLSLLVGLFGINVERTQKNDQPTEKKPVSKQSSVTPQDDPTSYLYVVNKKRPLPDKYTPSDLNGPMRAEAKKSIDNLFAGAKSANTSLKIISGYRSQSTQASLYNGYVARDGQASADTYSARPRYSEHQTGLAVDIGNSNGSCDLEICFGDSLAGQWLKANAQNYGFVIRYPKDKTSITGYQYEPWHLRYVGTETAKSVASSGKTLEEYFNLPPAPNY